ALSLRNLGQPYPLVAQPRALPGGGAGRGGPLAGAGEAAPAGDEATRPVGRCLPKRRPTGVWNDHDPRCSPTASVGEIFQESGGVVISSTGDGSGGRQVRRKA